MRVVECNKAQLVDGKMYTPFTRYVTSDFSAAQFLEMSPPGTWHMSSFNAWERRYAGQDLNGKSVCIYRHNAWGDQLIVSAVPAELMRRYPTATIHLYCHPQVVPLWWGNVFVQGSALELPIPFDALRGYDYTIFYEGMLEMNSEHDQHCCYDDFFGVIGLHDVPDWVKRPCITELPMDYAILDRLGIRKTWAKGKYLTYHMSPANQNRCYPPELSRKVLRKLSKDFEIFVVGLDARGEYSHYLKGLGKNVHNFLGVTKNFRELIPFVSRAACVICPDSAVLHLAAVFPQVPIVSLWGLFHPNDRAKYYPNNYPLFPGKKICSYAPCRNHEFKLPRGQCREAKGAPRVECIEYCQVLASIKPEEVVDAVHRQVNGEKADLQVEG